MSTYIRPGGAFFCAIERSASPSPQVIGCSGVLFHGEQSELHRMYLLSRCRGQGIGRALLDACIECATRAGCTSMIAWSDVLLTSAHAMYRKAGFVQEGQRICNDPDQSREYGFRKALL